MTKLDVFACAKCKRLGQYIGRGEPRDSNDLLCVRCFEMNTANLETGEELPA